VSPVPREQEYNLAPSCFPPRQHCKLTLHQDAHIAEHFNPSIQLHAGTCTSLKAAVLGHI